MTSTPTNEPVRVRARTRRSISIGADEYEQVKQLADKNNVTMGVLVDRCITFALTRQKKPQ